MPSDNWTLKVGGTTDKSEEEIERMIDDIKQSDSEGR